MDKTANIRQQKRASRLSEQGYKRKTIWIHKEHESAFNVVKEYLKEPGYAENLEDIIAEMQKKIKPVNVSSVRQLSPFRYPGGKTWLVPEIKRRINGLYQKPAHFIEPFAGGGIISLTVAAENLAGKIIMGEKDPEVASIWKTILRNPDYLCDQIKHFDVTLPNVQEVINKNPTNLREKAFRAIIKNRTFRGGILAPGAGLVKSGENGKGLKSRWYPETLIKRIHAIHFMKSRICFFEEDAFSLLNKYANDKNAFFFIDPPYSYGKKSAGKRLYLYNEIDHVQLFGDMSKVKGDFIMTYDDTDEIVELAGQHNFKIDRLPMKNTHHRVIYELIITKG